MLHGENKVKFTVIIFPNTASHKSILPNAICTTGYEDATVPNDL
jgi:hypothetical protein